MDFTIAPGVITCNLCGKSSTNPNCVEYRYCLICKRFLDPAHMLKDGRLDRWRKLLVRDETLAGDHTTHKT